MNSAGLKKIPVNLMDKTRISVKRISLRKRRNEKIRTSCMYITLRSYITITREFDPGSGRTLAACLTHASRAGSFRNETSVDFWKWRAADG